MKTLRLSRGLHRGRKCIFFIAENDPELDHLIRSYPGRIWSNTRKCWYIPDEEDSYKKIMSHFRDRYIIDSTDLHLGESLDAASRNENEILPAVTEIKRVGSAANLGSVSLTVCNSNGRLLIRFNGRYDREWINELKQYGRPYYDNEKREWSLAANRTIIDSLTDYFTGRGIKLNILKERKPAATSRKRSETGSDIRTRALSQEAVSGLKKLGTFLREKRYSSHTINSYMSQMEFFLKYFNDKQPDAIDIEDITQFMDEYVITLGYSASYQNQMITAIKIYYSLMGDKSFDLEQIRRPRKGRPLPQVFSKEEITGILNSTRNLKHRLILWIIYSCGLRRSEVINIRLTDLNRERGILHIRSGKGSVDRVVPISEKVWTKLDEYVAAYHPVVYLFEGQSGGKYSSGSVHNVFKQALTRVGITREVGVHSLRHSYATHLHESGLDVRYIQELLGHKSSRTTEIYTHISRRNLINIRSPIDDLDLF